MVGKKTEREGLVKSGSLFVDAVSRSQVPHLSVICGASYGAGNYAVPSHFQVSINVNWIDVRTGLRTEIPIQLACIPMFCHGA